MQLHCGVFRFPDMLKQGVEKLREIEKRRGVAPATADSGHVEEQVAYLLERN